MPKLLTALTSRIFYTMNQSTEASSCDLKVLRRIHELAANSSEKIQIEFIKELNEQERNFTETLKRSNDRIEGLLIVNTPEIMLRDRPGLSEVVSTESRLNSLAKEFEKALKKAQEGGWSQLVEQIKETVARLCQLSQEEITHDEVTSSLASQGSVETTTCNCNVWGGDRLNERGQWVCDTCEEKCPCPEDNWPRVPDSRKRGHKARRVRVAITDERNEEAETRHSGVAEPCIVDLFAIEKSLIDKSADRKIVSDHCPLEEASNAKDKARRLLYGVKENGRTDSSKREPKEHVVQHGEVMQQSNVEDFDQQGARHRGTTKDDQMPRNECSEHRKSSGEDEVELCKLDEDIEEKNICTCGCENIEEDRGEQLCSCGCAEIRNLKDNEAIKGDDCECAELCDSCACELSSGRSTGSTSGIEEKTITTRNARSPNELGDIEAQRADKDIDKQAQNLEEEIDAVRAKNEKLKELFETCYCEEDIQQILALQCSQPAPIRDTHSGLMAAVQVLQSKCRSKDGMIAVLANELRGSESIDRIAKSLTAPCVRCPYLDFDQCGLHAYLKSPALPRSVAEEQAAVKKMPNPKAKEGIPPSKIRRTPERINFRVVRVISNCLLVSWNMPEDIRGIGGYEVRINRNIVAARVRCPTRTNAVLGPLDLSGHSTDLPGLMILTLYAVHDTGAHSELSSVKVQICNTL